MREFVVVSRRSAPLPAALAELLDRAELQGSIFRARSWQRRALHGGHTVLATRGLEADAPGGGARLPDVFVHGTAVADGRLVDERLDAAAADPVALVERARGAFCLVSAGARELVASADVFGLYPVWRWSDGDTVVATNNAHLVATVLAPLGERVGRNPLNSAWQLIYQAGVADSTGYEGVEWLPFGHYLSIAEPGDGTGPVARFLPFPSLEGGWPFRSELGAEELVERAREEIVENITVLTAAGHRDRVADLTGGQDSRLMLAAMLSTGASGEYSFHTDGGPTSPDANVAAALRERYGLARAAITLTPWKPAPPYLANLRLILYRGFGCFFQNVSMGMGMRSDPGLLHLNGGYGETLRSNFYKQIVDRPGLTPHGLFDRQIRMRGEAMLRPEVVERMRETLNDLFARDLASGADESDAGDLHYMQHRARQFFGTQYRARLDQRSAAYPLYSPSGIAAAFSLDGAVRGSNRIGFRLIEMLEPGLLGVPMAEDPWLPDAYSGRGDETELAAVEAVQTGDTQLRSDGHEDRVEEIQQPAYELPSQPRDEESDWQRRMRAEGRHWTWVRLDESLAVLRAVVQDPEAMDIVGAVFDPGKLRALALRPLGDFEQNTEVRRVHRTVGAVLWLTGRETVVQTEPRP